MYIVNVQCRAKNEFSQDKYVSLQLLVDRYSKEFNNHNWRLLFPWRGNKKTDFRPILRLLQSFIVILPKTLFTLWDIKIFLISDIYYFFFWITAGHRSSLSLFHLDTQRPQGFKNIYLFLFIIQDPNFSSNDFLKRWLISPSLLKKLREGHIQFSKNLFARNLKLFTYMVTFFFPLKRKFKKKGGMTPSALKLYTPLKAHVNFIISMSR